MKSVKLIALIALSFSPIFTPAVVATTTPKQWPHEGDLYYDGGAYADSIFSSHAPMGR